MLIYYKRATTYIQYVVCSKLDPAKCDPEGKSRTLGTFTYISVLLLRASIYV